MTALDLVLSLRRRRAVLTAVDERLSYRGPREVVTPKVVEELRREKGIIMALLQAEQENEPIPTKPCPVGHAHRRWWFSRHRHWVCQECHPPAGPELVVGWHEVRTGHEGAVPLRQETVATESKERGRDG